jgi:serine phosphatase RsbU (regulator of sigma subunit)
VGGVAMINPEKIVDNKLIPNVLMERIVVDNEIFSVTTPLIFEAGKQRFVFHYTALSLLAPQRVRFKYKLEGVDKQWNDAGTERQAIYTNLLPRSYVFRVIACNNDGSWNEIGTTLTFRLKPYFYQTWWFYALCFIAAISMGVLIYGQRVKQIHKRNAILEETVLVRTAELQQQKEETESQRDSLAEQSLQLAQANNEIKASNEKMTDSIRYALTIQQAVLPTREALLKLQDYFVLSQPKDIVSGDFYYFTEIKTNILGSQTFIVAVVDCTGHGVPGAFMSMIGTSLLNEIINAKNIHSPAKILKELHLLVQSSLKQAETKNSDGMDVCMCKLEYVSNENLTQNETCKVSFAGAKRSLYYSQEGILLEQKGDRYSIGGVRYKADMVFTDWVYDLQSGECLYLITDGIIDQSSANQEKFGSVRLKELLAKNLKLDMKIQYEILLKTLETHKENEIQRDDITVFGVKI